MARHTKNTGPSLLQAFREGGIQQAFQTLTPKKILPVALTTGLVGLCLILNNSVVDHHEGQDTLNNFKAGGKNISAILDSAAKKDTVKFTID